MDDRLVDGHQKQMKKINSNPNNQLNYDEDNIYISLNANVQVQEIGKYDKQKIIDNLIEQQEYKQVQNLLQPINVNEERLSPQQKDPNIIMMNQQEQKRQPPLKTPKLMPPSNNLKNPIGSLRAYMQNMQQFSEAIKEPIDLTKEKLNLPVKKQVAGIKLEEMITLNVIMGSRHSGAVKKIFHAPTTKLYAVKEVPLVNKHTRYNILHWTRLWSNFHHTGRHVKLYGQFWNVPEGCVSILTEFLPGGSLQDLLENFGTLPEVIINSILRQIIDALIDVHNASTYSFGGITPSQILFKQDGTVKLSLGLTYRSQQDQSLLGSFASKQNDKNSANEANNILNGWMYNNKQDSNSNNNNSNNNNNNNHNGNNNHNNKQKEQQMKSEDVFRVGMLALICAIGSLDILEHLNLFYECIHKLLEDANSTNPIYKNACCILHAEDIINNLIEDKLKSQLINNGNNNNINNGNEDDLKYYNLSINRLLGKRLSENFEDFLCGSLRFNHQQRLTMQQLRQHSFLTNQQIKGVNIKIQDLLKHSQGWCRNSSLPTHFQGASEQVLDRLCEGMLLVLPNCEKWFKDKNYYEYIRHIKYLKPDSPYIQALSQDLGIDAAIVTQKIFQVYESFPFIPTKTTKINDNNNNNGQSQPSQPQQQNQQQQQQQLQQ